MARFQRRKTSSVGLANGRLVIDGCQVGCAKAIMDNAKIPMKNYVVLTDLGIEKDKNFDLKQEDIAAVKDAAQKCFD